VTRAQETTVASNVSPDDVQRMLAILEPRQAWVLRLRYGLDGGEPMTLEQVGTRHGMTRERVRQIEDEALKRLRGNFKLV